MQYVWKYSPHREWYYYPKKAPTFKESETEDEEILVLVFISWRFFMV